MALLEVNAVNIQVINKVVIQIITLLDYYGSGVMSGTKLTPNRALANARLGTIKVNTQFGCRPNWALVNAQLGFLTPNSET